MKTIFGRKSLQAIENQESVHTLCCFNDGLSRHRRNLRGGSQPRRATHHGNSPDCRGSSRETKTLQSSRNLPNVRPSLEFADDRTGDVAVVPATSEAGAV